MTQAMMTDHPIAAPGSSQALTADVAQAYDLLTCALQAWSAYWTACFSARGLDDLYRANAELAAEGFTLPGHVAAERQRVGGIITPTLNDA